MPLEKCIGTIVICLKTFEFGGDALSGQGGSSDKGTTLLPGVKSSLTLFEQELIFRTNPQLGRNCRSHGIPPLYPARAVRPTR